MEIEIESVGQENILGVDKESRAMQPISSW